MSDIVYLYPKTSCPCGDCENNKCEIPTGFPSNMSVRGCTIPKCLDCNNRVFLNKKKVGENEVKNSWTEINPQVYAEKFASGFGKMPCPVEKGCNDPSYMSWDPRLYSTTRMNYLPLDQPPIDGDVRLKNIYKKKWDGYGVGYTPYEKVRDGQILYYTDNSIENPYFRPVFAEPAEEVAVLYQDPMGSIKPEYTRIPTTNTRNPTTTCQDTYPCLSFIQDSQSHREDLLSYQMRKRNQERYESRWSV